MTCKCDVCDSEDIADNPLLCGKCADAVRAHAGEGIPLFADFDRAVLQALESLEAEADYQSDTPRPYTTEDDIARRWLRDMVRGALHRAAAASRARMTLERRIVEWTTDGVEG